MTRTLGFTVAAWAAVCGTVQPEVSGTATNFTSPNGVEESCVAIASIPGRVYSRQDRAEERRLCSIDR